MSTDNVNRQLEKTKEKIRRAKEAIASLEKTVAEIERKNAAQSNGQLAGRATQCLRHYLEPWLSRVAQEVGLFSAKTPCNVTRPCDSACIHDAAHSKQESM
jgi:hypothetical protein